MISSAILIFNSEGKVLLQHRDNNAPTNPNKWGMFGGAIEEGETPIDAAIREIKEELSIDVASEDLTLLGKYDKPDGQFGGYVFALEDRGQYVFNQKEGDNMRYFSEEELKDIELTPYSNPKNTTILSDLFAFSRTKRT